VDVAARLGDGLFSATADILTADTHHDWRALLMWGSVLEPGESPTSGRVMDAVGPAIAVLYHLTYDRGGVAVDELPGGRRWRESVEAVPADQRHLAVHAGHQIELNEHDQLVAADARSLVAAAAHVGSVVQLREQLLAWRAAGITEIAYQPGGRDITGELERFARAADGI
jgi:5,10-methylenetetrahydromethanopterin reductase